MLIKIEREGNRIMLRCPYREDIPERCKSVLGARWSKENRAWSYPLDLETCRRLRDTFGADLEIGPDLWAWAATEVERETIAIPMVSKATAAILAAVKLEQVPLVAPTMNEALSNRGYQPAAVLFAATMRNCLIADEPGLGKTLVTLAALVEMGLSGRVLVLAPKKSSKLVWAHEIPRWLVDYKYGYTMAIATGLTAVKRKSLINAFAAASRHDDGKLHFLVCNQEMARVKKGKICPLDLCDGEQDWCEGKAKHKGTNTPHESTLFDVEWDAIIGDETHKALINSRGKRASQVGYGFTKLRSTPLGVRIALSGTPLKGKKHNLFGTLNWLRPDIYTSKWRWIRSYFETMEDGYSEVVGKLRDDKLEAFYRSIAPLMIRRTKSELRAINPEWVPPDKLYHDVWVDLEGKQVAAYKAMEKDAFAEIMGGQLSATGILAEMMRLKQLSGCYGRIEQRIRMRDGEPETYNHFIPTMPSGKFDWLVEFLAERGIEPNHELSDDVRKVIVASQFTSFIDLWASELRRMGIDVHVLTGNTKDHDAEVIVDDFQKGDRVRVFLINTMAGGVSITLDRADDVVIMDETWVPDDQLQVEDRCHRTSNAKHQVDVWYLRSASTIEEGIATLNMNKAESNHVVLDAQRGLAFARSLQMKGKG